MVMDKKGAYFWRLSKSIGAYSLLKGLARKLLNDFMHIHLCPSYCLTTARDPYFPKGTI
ncbi:MAG: hypothetical protein ACI88H_004103 [Cocleimonas sp.]|jgi:hypothetical protein